jgi:hypothetical protein
VVSAGAYALDIISLAAVGLSLGFSGFRIRRHLLPAWDGAPARLVEAVLGVALLVWLCQLLGLFGLLHAWTLVAEALLLAAAVALWPLGARGERPDTGGGGPQAPAASLAMGVAAIAVAALVFVQWGAATGAVADRGIFIFDSLWYHMPFAAEIAQSHSVTGLHRTDTVYTNWFYPQSSELLHGVGILLVGRDTLSLFLNLGWLGLAFLAAWCVGRPYGRGPLSVVAAAIVLGSPTMVELEPGQAKNDVMAAALLLAALAILVNLRAEGQRTVSPGWGLAAVGLAAGLAAGTRAPALAMVAALGLAAVALAPSGRRGVAALWWGVPALAGGGFWYLRNLLAAGNPLPQVESLGPISLPHPEQVQSGRPDFTVAHYLFDGQIWSEWFVPGLEFTFGTLWPLVFGAAIAGATIAAFQKRDRVLRWVGFVALAGLLAYLVTPLSAAGPEGSPVAFNFNLRFVAPALLAGLALLPLAGALGSSRRQWAALAVLVAVFLATDDVERLLDHEHLLFGLVLALVLVAAPAALLLTRRPGDPLASLAAPLCVLALLAAGAGYGVQRDYLEQRYGPQSGLPGYGLEPAYAWAREVSDARIGLAGTIAGLQGYGFYGADLSNRVAYLGEEGPRGAFNPIPTCARFRAAVNAADLDYLVTAPRLDFIVRGRLLPSPEARWLAGEDAVEPIVRNGEVTVWRVDRRLDPGDCGPENAPLA